MRKAIALIVLSVVGVMFLSACRTPMTRKSARMQPELAEDVYLANNIHAQDDGQYYTASYANWTQPRRHRIVPVNTRVDVHRWDTGFVILGKGEDEVTVFVEYDPRHMDLSKKEYVEKITTTEKVDLDALSETDQKGIERGEAWEGMTKEGVRIALGHPAQHETPSLDDDTWTYWTNRWSRYDVVFDDDGKVKEIRE